LLYDRHYYGNDKTWGEESLRGPVGVGFLAAPQITSTVNPNGAARNDDDGWIFLTKQKE